MYDRYITRILVAGSILFVVFACFLIFFIVYMRARQHTQYLERQSVQFNRQLAKIDEYERTLTELGKYIHDHILQNNLLIKMELASLYKLEGEKQHTLLHNIKKAMVRVIDDAEQISFCLNHDYIRSQDISCLLKAALKKTADANSIEAFFDTRGKQRPVNGEVKLVIFRVFQEAVENVVRHSSATKIEVTLDFFEYYLVLSILDNGIGIPEEKKHASYSIGIGNMYRRARLLDGELNITSMLGSGCMITLSVPDKAALL